MAAYFMSIAEERERAGRGGRTRNPRAMRGWQITWAGLAMVIGVLLVACSATASNPAQSGSPQTSTGASNSAGAQPSPSLAIASAPRASQAQGPVPHDWIAITLVDRVRVRSAPLVGEESKLLAPVLPVGTTLFVLDGPVQASGYDWYQVVPVSLKGLSHPGFGWVAAADRQGERWLGPGSADCPPVPGNLAALRGLSAGERLACFAGRPITVEARLLQFDGEVDGPDRFEPAWFNDGPAYPPHLLVDVTCGGCDPTAHWFGLHLDPAHEFPEPLPLGTVRVTGLFDHPAARACTATTYEPVSTKPDPSCRWAFAVTSLTAVQP